MTPRTILHALEARWKGRKAVDALEVAPAVQDAVGAKSDPIPAVPAPPISPPESPALEEHPE
jgi:hypothetical protein